MEQWTIRDAETASRELVETFALRGWNVSTRVAYTRGAWTAQCVVHETDKWAPNAPYVFAEAISASLAEAIVRLGSVAEDEYALRDVEEDEY